MLALEYLLFQGKCVDGLAGIGFVRFA